MRIDAVRSNPVVHTTPLEEIEHDAVEARQTPLGVGATLDHMEASLSESPPLISRPKLPVAEKLAQLLEMQEATTTKALELDTKRLSNAQAILARTNESVMQEIEKRNAKATEVSMWGMLADVAQFLTSAGSILTGGALIATGSPIGILSGGALIVGGVSSITALSLSNYGGDPQLAGTLAVLGAGLSLIGGVVSWNEIAHNLPQAVATIGQCALGVMKGTSMIGKAVSESSLSHIDALLAKKEATSKEVERDIEKTRDTMQQTVQQMNALVKKMNQTLRALHEAKRQILAG